MTKSPKGCGVIGHPDICLCDVRIQAPLPIKVTIPTDLQHGEFVANLIEFSPPYTSEEFARFLSEWARGMMLIQDERRVQLLIARNWIERTGDGSLITRKGSARLTDGQFIWLKDRIREGVQPTPLVRLMQEVHNTTIHKSYVSKLKNRMKECGEFYYED